MSWIKDSLLDLIFLLVILSAVFYPTNVSFTIIWFYTALLLVTKISALFMPGLQKRATKSSTPDVVYHIIYALSIAALLYLEKWYLAGLWALIWVLSIIMIFNYKKKDNT